MRPARLLRVVFQHFNLTDSFAPLAGSPQCRFELGTLPCVRPGGTSAVDMALRAQAHDPDVRTDNVASTTAKSSATKGARLAHRPVSSGAVRVREPGCLAYVIPVTYGAIGSEVRVWRGWPPLP